MTPTDSAGNAADSNRRSHTILTPRNHLRDNFVTQKSYPVLNIKVFGTNSGSVTATDSARDAADSNRRSHTILTPRDHLRDYFIA